MDPERRYREIQKQADTLKLFTNSDRRVRRNEWNTMKYGQFMQTDDVNVIKVIEVIITSNTVCGAWTAYYQLWQHGDTNKK